MKTILGKRIWDSPKPYNHTSKPDPDKIRLEFPSLVRFKGAWYCAFREAEIHYQHPSGKARVIRSLDGVKWDTVAMFQWEGGDVREPKFSITPEGMLMINTLIYFVSEKPREDGGFYQLDKIKKVLNMPESDEESVVTGQSVTWLSADGENWSSAYACPSGANTWLWDTTWYGGMGYSIAQWGKAINGTLYRTRDGKSWRALRKDFFPIGHAGEAALAFGEDGTAYGLLRGDSKTRVLIGIGEAPYYQEWTWKPGQIDWSGDGDLRPASEVLRVAFAGPKLLRLSDGRLLGAGRVLGPFRENGPRDPGDPEGKEDGSVTLFWIDPKNAILTCFCEVNGTSYPGVVEHEGMLWISYLGADRSGIFLAKVEIPRAQDHPR